jgi:hypothetical protein
LLMLRSIFKFNTSLKMKRKQINNILTGTGSVMTQPAFQVECIQRCIISYVGICPRKMLCWRKLTNN